MSARNDQDDVGGIDPEARADALDVLRDVLAWQLVEDRWQRVAGVLETMRTAVAAGDSAMVESATAELELASPVRVQRIGAISVRPAPEIVRERVNHLVHTLHGPARPGDATVSQNGQINDNDRPAAD